MSLITYQVLQSIEERLTAIEERTKPTELIFGELVAGEGLNNEELAEQVAAKVVAALAKPPRCPIHPVPDDPLAHTIEAMGEASKALEQAVKDWNVPAEWAKEVATAWNNTMYQIVERLKLKGIS